jgi:uncharacterized protein YrrD
MQLKLGDPVYSCDGQNLGKIRFLILAPSSAEIKTLVVEKGWLLPEDIELPLDAIQETGEKGVRVGYTAEQAKSLPHFEESRYIPASPEHTRAFQGYPFGGLLWPNGYGVPMFTPAGYPLPVPVAEEEKEASPSTEAEEPPEPQETCTAVISAGDEVISREGEKVGEVHSVTFDSATRRPTHLVVRRGWLFHEDRELPAEVIASVENGAVYLNLERDQIEGRNRIGSRSQ